MSEHVQAGLNLAYTLNVMLDHFYILSLFLLNVINLISFTCICIIE